MKPSANAPRSSDSAALTASTGLMPFCSMVSTRCSTISVSVCVLKTAPCFSSSFAKLAEILDDAVMHHGDAFGGVRMSVVLGRLAMGGPAGVTDAGVTVERSIVQPLLEILQLAFGAPALERLALQRRDTGGIVTAIFEPLEEIDQLLRDWSTPQNADNAAHAVFPQFERYRRTPERCLTEILKQKVLKNYCGLRQWLSLKLNDFCDSQGAPKLRNPAASQAFLILSNPAPLVQR